MNKGFTLVELLGTIVILAIIMAIAVPSITSISSVIKEKQREHLIEKIEIAAAKYAYDTGENVVLVEELVEKGYLDADKDNTIKDPLSLNELKCYAVEMEKKKDYYTAKFVDKNYLEFYNGNWICDIGVYKNEDSCLTFSVNGEEIYYDAELDWMSGEIILSAEGCDINCEVDKCVWTSSSGANIVGTNEIKIDKKLLNTKYTFHLTYFGDDSDEVFNKYEISLNLKIDNEGPTIYENEIKVTDKFIYTPSKRVTISATDGHGSGIDGYYLGINNGESCDNTDLEYVSNKTFSVTENGDYLICVKDKVGNTSKYTMSINYIS